MNTLESLDLLEDRVQLLTLRYTQLSEENQQLRDELDSERQSTQELYLENENLRKEVARFEDIRNLIRSKIETLITQLTEEEKEENQEIERHSGPRLTKEEAEALSKPLTDDLFVNTTINFLPEEDT